MIVCLCRAVSDRAIRAAVAAGAGSPTAVADACGAGAGCGRCRDMLDRLIAEAQVGSCSTRS
jgi:bacterioferritin-associated ferredoxin